MMLSDMDINAIAGTLKLYFRELPEPLLTDRLHPAFMEGIGTCAFVVIIGGRFGLLQGGFAQLNEMRAKVKKLSHHNGIWHLFFPLHRSSLRPGGQGELHDAPPSLPAGPQPHDLPYSAGAPQTVHTHTMKNPPSCTGTTTGHSFATCQSTFFHPFDICTFRYKVQNHRWKPFLILSHHILMWQIFC